MDPENSGSNGSPRTEKTRIIRNREVDRAAKTMAEKSVLPEAPGANLSWSQMQEYFGLLTPEMWHHFSVYVYRLRPKIRRQLKDPNSPNYIDCFGEPFSLEYFIGRHGGGKYMLQATDTDKKRSKGESQEVFQCFFEVDDVKNPPILEYEELEVEARENQSYVTWLRKQGILDARGNVVQANSTPAANGPGLKEVVEALKAVNSLTEDRLNQMKPLKSSDDDTLSKAVGSILVERMKQDDPAKLVTAVKEMMDSGKSDSGIAKIYEHLIVMQQDQRKSDAEQRTEQRKLDAEQRKHDMEMLKMLLEAHRPQPDADIDKLNKIMNLAQQIFDSRGPGGKRTGWDIGLDIAKEVALPAIQSFGGILTNIMALRRGGQMPAPAAPPVPTSFDPYRDTAAAAAYASSIRNQTPPPAPAATPPAQSAAGPSPNPPNNPAIQIFHQYGQLVLNALNNGTPGYALADYVVGLLGTATHAMIANHGEDDLVSAMLSIPEFVVFGEPRLRTFAHEFIAFEEFSDEPAGEDEIDVSKVYQPPPRERAQPHR